MKTQASNISSSNPKLPKRRSVDFQSHHSLSPKRGRTRASNLPVIDPELWDRQFAYKNTFLTSSYHLVHHKHARSDSLQIVPSSSPDLGNKPHLVAFDKLAKRNLGAEGSNKARRTLGADWWNNMLNKHVPTPNFSVMKQRDSDVYLTNKVWVRSIFLIFGIDTVRRIMSIIKKLQWQTYAKGYWSLVLNVIEIGRWTY